MSLCVSFDCDFLSEELVGGRRTDGVEVFCIYGRRAEQARRLVAGWWGGL